MAKEKRLSREKKAAEQPKISGRKPETEKRKPSWAERECLNKMLLGAADKGDNAKIKRLLKAEADVNPKALRYGQAALTNAAWLGHIETCALLIDNGANIDAKDYYGRTALMYAAGRGHTETCAILIEKGASIYAKTDMQQTAFDFSKSSHKKDTIAFLKFATNIPPGLFASKKASNSFYFSFRDCISQ
jgi:ankyrin repeat protein